MRQECPIVLFVVKNLWCFVQSAPFVCQVSCALYLVLGWFRNKSSESFAVKNVCIGSKLFDISQSFIRLRTVTFKLRVVTSQRQNHSQLEPPTEQAF